MKAKQVILPLLAYYMICFCCMSVSSCSENEILDSSDLSNSPLRDNAAPTFTELKISHLDSIAVDSICKAQADNPFVPTAIEYDKIYNGDFKCKITGGPITFCYTAYDDRLFPPQIFEKNSSEHHIEFDNSGFGSSTYNVYYKCPLYTDNYCTITIRIIDTRVYVGMMTKMHTHTMTVKFDTSHTAQVRYIQE